ncbi:MAG: Gfo/Idh/MocA family oxidoreductase [Candidatus Poribacteria bacterium]|nr:Gfo/Idh/MocA family oxidoreductase [Candidatus Poribacteria bacterium]
MTYRVGIIGCGRMANTIEDEQIARRKQGTYRGGIVLPYCHAGGYAVVEETEIVVACDIVKEKLQTFCERWNVPRGYTDFRELIEVEQPDILSITTRPEQHAEAMIYGAEHGVKGMYAEKPLCCSLAEADAIRDAFERNKVFLAFGPARRNRAYFQKAREIAESGELGAVKSALGFGGNSIGGHFLDTLLYFLGDPEPVVSIRGTLGELYPDERDTSNMRFVKDTPILSALVEFDNSTTLHAAATGARGEFELVCEGGIIRIQNDGESISVRKRDTDTRAYDPVEVEPVTPFSGTERKIRELVESIKTGVPGASNLRATMLSTEIGFGIYESHLQGGVAVRPPVPNRERWISSW